MAAKQRYSSVRVEDNLNGSKDGVSDDNNKALHRFKLHERHEEVDDRDVSENPDTAAASANTKHLPTDYQSKQWQPNEVSEDEVEEQRNGAADDGFHPARLLSPPAISMLHTSSDSSPLSRLFSFLRLHLNRYYVVLLVALLAISCSGTLLRELPNTPPLLKGQHAIARHNLI